MAADAALQTVVQQHSWRHVLDSCEEAAVCIVMDLYWAFSMLASQLCMQSLTLAWGPLQALATLSCLLSHLCFSSSPLLPMPSQHPWWQGYSILGSSPCLIQLSFKPAQSFFGFGHSPIQIHLVFSALLLSPRHPVPLCPLQH